MSIIKKAGRLLTIQLLLITSSATATATTAFDSFVQLQLKKDGPGVAYIVTKHGETLYSGAYGMANLEAGVALSPDSIFNLASITKQFTAAAIMQLQEQGKLNVKDTITKYLPEFPTQGHSISIEHLLTHTAGLARDQRTRSNDSKISSAQLMQLFAAEPLQFVPGEKMQYSNMGYKILGRIIEVVTGQPYGDYIEQHLFAKLGMKHSNYGHRHSGAAKAIGYVHSWHHGYQRSDMPDISWNYAGGGLASSAQDLALWYQALQAGQLISLNSYQQMINPFTLNDGSSSSYGYGLNNIELHNRKVIIHQGGLPGYSTSAAYFPEEGIYAAVLSNRQHTDTFALLSVLTGEQFGLTYPNFTPIELTAAEQQQIIGDYQTSSGAIRKLFIEDGIMYSRLDKSLVYAITPLVDNTFLYTNSTGYFTITAELTGRHIMTFYPDFTANAEIAVKLP